MPRKKDGMPFESFPSPKADANGEKVLYIKPKSGLKVTLRDLENYCSMGYSLRKGDMGRVFDTFVDVAAIFMAQGYRIETPIGTFVPKLGLKRQITNPDDIKHDDAELQGIEFKTAKPFEKALQRKIGRQGFLYVRNPSSSRLMANVEDMDKALQKSIRANNGYTTVSSFAFYSGLTEHSARKMLNRWCLGNSPRLQRTFFGHALIYTEI